MKNQTELVDEPAGEIRTIAGAMARFEEFLSHSQYEAALQTSLVLRTLCENQRGFDEQVAVMMAKVLQSSDIPRIKMCGLLQELHGLQFDAAESAALNRQSCTSTAIAA